MMEPHISEPSFCCNEKFQNICVLKVQNSLFYKSFASVFSDSPLPPSRVFSPGRRCSYGTQEVMFSESIDNAHITHPKVPSLANFLMKLVKIYLI